MMLGTVKGTITSTINHPFYTGKKLLVVEKEDFAGKPGGYLIAIDGGVSAGIGERVLRYDVTIESNSDGYTASCEDPQCSATGLSKTNALDALREEIRYRVELCPCTTVDDGFVELSVISTL
jgi:microcompartment protein CcmK/EutM